MMHSQTNIKGSRALHWFILNLDIRWGDWSAAWPNLFTFVDENPVPTELEAQRFPIIIFRKLEC